MAKQNEINFYLKNRTAKGENQRKNPPMAQIWLYYSLGNGTVNRLEYYTGERIDPEKWDTENKWVKPKYRREQMELIKRLESLKTTVQGIADKARVLNIPLSPAYFKKQLSTPEITPTSEDQKTIEDIIKIYLKECENHKTKATIRNIKVSLQVFRDFVTDNDFRIERGVEKPLQFEFDTINREWYNYFLDYCFNVRDFANNYTGTCIKNLKAFLNWAYEAKYNTNDACKMKWFKKLQEEGEIIYLTYEELMFLYRAKIENTELAQVRDLFCFGCFSGMRFSDINSLSPENVFKDHITFRIQKVKTVHTVPLNKFSAEILKRYEGKIPNRCLPQFVKQTVNGLLKDLFEEVKLTRKVQKTYFKGAEAIKQTFPLNEIITFHISKKTFMTNFLAKGGSLTTAMAITGNKDVKTAKRYYTVVAELKQKEMNEVFK